MLAQIEEAIVGRVKTKLAAVAGTLAVQRGAEGLPQPAVYVSTEAGRFQAVTQQSFRQELTIFVDVIFSELSSEGERRKGVYLILQGIIQTLLLQQLGLAIKPIVPTSWRNTTTEEYREQGLIVYSLELATSYVISKLDDEATVDLLTVGLNYYLKPGDDTVDASDTVTLAP
ncbi:MAG: phage protein Gp37 [Thermodesulfobacteriota bacterium]